MPGVEDFDRSVDERGIAEEAYPAAFALWLAEISGGPGAVAHLHGQVPAARLTLRFPALA